MLLWGWAFPQASLCKGEQALPGAADTHGVNQQSSSYAPSVKGLAPRFFLFHLLRNGDR